MNDTTSSQVPVNPPVRLANPRRTTLASVRSHAELREQANAHAEERQAS